MIYVLAVVLILTAARVACAARRRGARRVLRGLAAAGVLGLLAGVFIGVGARVGMSAITIANGEVPRPTASGSLNVVLTFSALGLPLGVVYEGLVRHLLRRKKALTFGALLTLCTAYPLAQAAAQQINAPMNFAALALVSVLMVALMWLPYALALEWLLARWERWRERRAAPAAGDAA